jgi:hypothetical protein
MSNGDTLVRILFAADANGVGLGVRSEGYGPADWRP